MCQDFEIRVEGHTLVRVKEGGVRIDGKDFHSDLKNLSELIEILSSVVGSAQEAGKPRLIASSGETIAALPHKTADGGFPYKVISNF